MQYCPASKSQWLMKIWKAGCFLAWLLEVQFKNQHHWHHIAQELGKMQNPRTYPDLLGQNPTFSKLPRAFVCSWKHASGAFMSTRIYGLLKYG
jgi:hypothetical protein